MHAPTARPSGRSIVSPVLPIAVNFLNLVLAVPLLAQSPGGLPPTLPRPQATASDRPFLGLQTEDLGESEGEYGVRVVYVFPYSAASEMGFRLGDVLLALNDVLLSSREEFVREVRNNNINGKLRFLVKRGGERLKVNGKIGSYRKTMETYQDALRKRFEGKPLPAPPAASWWRADGTWEEKDRTQESIRDKLAVVFSFDDCPFCQQRKIPKLTQMQKILAKTSPGSPLAFLGYYFAGQKTPDEARKAAEKVFPQMKAEYPLALAYYPEGVETEREKQALLHHHGVAILDPKGVVVYFQIVGAPEREFVTAYQKALQALAGSGGSPKPEEESADGQGETSGESSRGPSGTDSREP